VEEDIPVHVCKGWGVVSRFGVQQPVMIIMKISSENEDAKFNYKKYNGINPVHDVKGKEHHTHPPYNGMKFERLHGKW